MYTLYYLNTADNVYYQQKQEYTELKDAKFGFNPKRTGYIKNALGKIVRRFKSVK